MGVLAHGGIILKDFKKVWQVASVYVGTVVGAGFATGKEIVEFFSQFGLLGLLEIIIAGYLFIYFGNKMMLSSLKSNSQDYFAYNRWLFGRRFSPILNILFFTMLLGVTAVMLAGSGEVIFEQFHMQKWIGMVITSVFAIIVMLWGIKGLSLVNMFVVPSMIFFNIILVIMAVRSGFDLDKLLYIPYHDHLWLAIVMPISYVAFNLTLSQAVFLPLAREIKNPAIIRKGAVLGGALLTLILLLSHISLTIFQDAQSFAIPTAAVMKSVAPFLHGFYLMIILGEIFSSIIGNAFGIEQQLKPKLKWQSIAIYISLFVICFAIARFEYAPLLTFLYPIFGYLSILFLVILLFKKIN